MDETLITQWAIACKRGDERSFRLLVEALSRTLIAMAYRYTGDWEWARDLTQDTWVRVWEHIDSFDADRPFWGWLHSVHRNGCLDHARRAWVRREALPGHQALEGLAGPASGDAALEAERREFRERVLAAAEGLTPRQREVFLRVDLEEGDQRTVAQEIGITPGALRTTLHFARKRIALALRPREEKS